jgi:FAD synthetase
VPYCVLYDQGYVLEINLFVFELIHRFTSLGGTSDTHANPSLKSKAGSGFRPAYELLDETKERCGRER